MLLSSLSIRAQAPASASPQPGQSPAMNNPTRPEIQPPLDTDRDPIPSPDIVVPPPPTSSSNIPTVNGQVQKKSEGVYTLHEDVDEVLLSCAVVDEKGRPVLDLNRNNFRVWEDGAPQIVRSFVHQDLPVSMGLLIDSSGSMLDKRTAVDQAALRLLAESNPRDSAFVVNFNERAYLDQGFTMDRVAIERGIDRFEARGPTAMYDAVAASADELSKNAKQPKQVLLIITDGADNASRLNRDEAIRRVQNLGGPVVYTIGLLFDSDPREYQKAHDDLETLAEETGGMAYFPRSLDQVNEIASEVARDIRNQYIVGYHSTRAASLGGYRTVHVEAQAGGHGKLTVRTRRGYYAKPGQKTGMTARQSAAPPQ
ncbi:MAG TPA: VWA domain-containing protein [Terracidiphilus sp.]|jgi:VWFA-related protein|nr:VWA domain-containing protein [Terracidiphilus sp.]